MKWPWTGAIERRVEAVIEERGYGDLILAGLEATVTGATGSVLKTSALETASGMWARVLAGAVVTGDRGALTRRVRHMIGRSLIRSGELLFVIDVQDGQVRLLAASSFEVMEGWQYRAEVQQPPGKSASRTYPRSAVVHFMWNCDPLQPWAGISPLGSASYGAKLAANTEAKLAEETGAPSALLLPVPTDGGDASLDALRADIRNAKGGAVVLEGTAAGWDDETKGTRNDWKAERLGPMIPEQLRALHGDACAAVLEACGIPAALGSADADGTSQRESYRRWIMASVEPVAELIAEEASEKLDSEVAFDFRGVWAHDLAGRASAYAKVVTAGMDADRAAALAGLMTPEAA